MHMFIAPFYNNPKLETNLKCTHKWNDRQAMINYTMEVLHSSKKEQVVDSRNMIERSSMHFGECKKPDSCMIPFRWHYWKGKL